MTYGIVKAKQNLGLGTEVCKLLVDIANETDNAVSITARTLTEENASTRILVKNGFKLKGEIMDKEDGLVWEWELQRF